MNASGVSVTRPSSSLRVAALVAAAGIAAACASSTAPPAPFSGTYQLASVDGHGLPDTVDTASGGQLISSGTLTVTGSDSVELDLGLGDALIAVQKAAFSVRGARLIVRVKNGLESAYADTGTIDQAGISLAHHWTTATTVSLRFER